MNYLQYERDSITRKVLRFLPVRCCFIGLGNGLSTSFTFCDPLSKRYNFFQNGALTPVHIVLYSTELDSIRGRGLVWNTSVSVCDEPNSF